MEQETSLQPDVTVVCIVCGKVGAQVNGDDVWLLESSLTVCDDGEDKYLDGDALTEADETKWGWVCCDRCQSQAIYDHASDSEKRALDAVRDACIAIAEHGSTAQQVLSHHSVYRVGNDLTSAALALLDNIHNTPDDPPAWCNRQTREEALEQTARKALFRLESIAAWNLGWEAQFEANRDRPDSIRVQEFALPAIKVANVDIALRDALQ